MFEKPVMIVEGRFEDVQRFTRIHRNSLLGAYISLGIGMNITLINSKDEEETAEIIKRIAMYQQEMRRPPTSSRPTLKNAKDSIHEWQLYILQCFPHIGPKIAHRIAEKFQSLRDFCNASVTELSRIEGLSERKATEIYQILNSPTTKSSEISRSKHIVDYVNREGSVNNTTQ